MPGRTILVVEDNDKNMKLFRDVLNAAGYRTLEASTGRQAVELATQHLPTLVLMDIQLPGIDGVEATRALVDLPHAPVVVLLSTYDEDQVDAAGCGAASYLPKGAFGPDRLVAAWEAAPRQG